MKGLHGAFVRVNKFLEPRAEIWPPPDTSTNTLWEVTSSLWKTTGLGTGFVSLVCGSLHGISEGGKLRSPPYAAPGTGFSRGAYTARALAGLLFKVILRFAELKRNARAWSHDVPRFYLRLDWVVAEKQHRAGSIRL